jgi:hypothetical protein
MDPKTQAELDAIALETARLNLEEARESNATRTARRVQKKRDFETRQRGFQIATKERKRFSDGCMHLQGGNMDNPREAKATNPSALNVARMPDGWTRRISCIVCRGEWFTPHPYNMRKTPFPAGFHMPGGIILERAETMSEVKARIAKYEADVEVFERLLKMQKDKSTREASQEMDCGTTHTLTNSETGVVVYPWRPCDASAMAQAAA